MPFTSSVGCFDNRRLTCSDLTLSEVTSFDSVLARCIDRMKDEVSKPQTAVPMCARGLSALLVMASFCVCGVPIVSLVPFGTWPLQLEVRKSVLGCLEQVVTAQSAREEEGDDELAKLQTDLATLSALEHRLLTGGGADASRVPRWS